MAARTRPRRALAADNGRLPQLAAALIRVSLSRTAADDIKASLHG